MEVRPARGVSDLADEVLPPRTSNRAGEFAVVTEIGRRLPGTQQREVSRQEAARGRASSAPSRSAVLLRRRSTSAPPRGAASGARGAGERST